MCKSWEDTDKNKIIQHILARGLKPTDHGTFITPIAFDFKGRKSLEMDPSNMGYCRRDCILTDALATCPAWKPTQTISDFQNRMRRR